MDETDLSGDDAHQILPPMLQGPNRVLRGEGVDGAGTVLAASPEDAREGHPGPAVPVPDLVSATGGHPGPAQLTINRALQADRLHQVHRAARCTDQAGSGYVSPSPADREPGR
ncbi:hypothetical protein GCM10023317_84990 [Actinopolymorpha pittospori]